MNVARLIEILRELPADAQVIAAHDQEGNGFGSYVNVSQEYILRGEGKHGYVDGLIAEKDIGTEYGRDEVAPVVVIWP